MGRHRGRIVASIIAIALLFGAPAKAADTKAPAPGAAAKAAPAATPAKAPLSKPWVDFKFGMTSDQVRKVLGKGLEPLKAPYRLGDYKAEYRGAPVQITKGVAMRPLPLFHWQRDSLEMLVLTTGRATGRDFVEVYQMLSKTFGESRREHSQFKGPYQVFDVSWKTQATSIALYYDAGGKLLTLEIARTNAASPELYPDEPWLRASEWAASCACDYPLYYNRCPTTDTAQYH